MQALSYFRREMVIIIALYRMGNYCTKTEYLEVKPLILPTLDPVHTNLEL